MTRAAIVRSLAIVPVAALLFALAPWSAASAEDKPQQTTTDKSAAAKPSTPFPGEDAEAKRNDIRRLLELNGAKAMMKAQITPMMDSFEGLPGMTPDMVEVMRAEFMESLDEMLELALQPYADHLSHEDIKILIAFAETPTGQRLAAAQPKIVAETSALGMKWGQSLQPRLMKRLDELRRKKAEGTN